jgi:cytochrome P450
MNELTTYLSELVRDHERHPSDDLLSTLIAARDDNDSLSHDEVISTGVLLLFAGHETTTNLIGSSTMALHHHPDQLALLESDPGLLDSAVEELVRYDGPAKSVVRLVAGDGEFHGHQMRNRQRVFLFLSGANRDASAFEDPDKLDITRRPGRQLGFSAGMHYCLGAPLARLETAIAVPLAMRRLPGFTPVVESIRWSPTLLTRGMESLPVRFDAP